MSNDAVGRVTRTPRVPGGRPPVADAPDAWPAITAEAGGARPLLRAEPVMGTVVSFRVHPGAGTADRAAAAVEEACRALHAVDATFSTWLPGSPVSRLRRGEASMAEMPPEVDEVLGLCREAKARSRGWFDPWSMPGGVDPTGLVKGWSLDRALVILRHAGAEAALLNAGGDLVGFGSPGPDEVWRIGIRHPWASDALACVVRLDVAVATSGVYERGPHLVDPRTRGPARAAASATVTGPSLAMCDALSTALAVGGDDAYDAVAAFDGYEAYVIGADGSERATDGMAFVD